jgi:hypothetical protein
MRRLILIGFTIALSLNSLNALSAPAGALASVIIKANEETPIEPTIYGVNNGWDVIDGDRFPAFENALAATTHFSIMRFPGGWESEHYDWKTNQTPGWAKAPTLPGVDPDGLLGLVPKASFVLPTEDALQGREDLASAVALAKNLVARYGTRVGIWEIGNEWWLQAGAKKNDSTRAETLLRYARLVAAMAPALKAVNPSIEVFASVDWTSPEQVSALRQAVGDSAWQAVDGISIHAYCGDLGQVNDCNTLGNVVSSIRSLSGKRRLFASEWGVVLRLTGNKRGLEESSLIVQTFAQMAQARVEAAAYWPPANYVPASSLIGKDLLTSTALGQLFGAISANYRGLALKTTGQLPADAAIQSDGTLHLIIPAGTDEPILVTVQVPPGRWSKVASATIIGAAGPVEANRFSTRQAEPAFDGSTLQLPLNGDDSAGWEVAVVTLR